MEISNLVETKSKIKIVEDDKDYLVEVPNPNPIIISEEDCKLEDTEEYKAMNDKTKSELQQILNILDDENISDEIKLNLVRYTGDPELLMKFIEDDIFDLFIEKFKKKYL